MRTAVRDAFVTYTSPLEGVVHFMYCDVLGLVTTGIGNLIDPAQMALGLPWLRADGSPATQREIAAEWMAVKARQDLKMQGGMAYKQVTRLHLDDAGVAALVMGKLDANDAFLIKRFPSFEDWPADAQLATHSLAWACGPAFRFPKLAAALENQDFDTAAAECTIHPEQGTIVKRNAAQRILYRNAAKVLACQLDPDELHWPNELT